MKWWSSPPTTITSASGRRTRRATRSTTVRKTMQRAAHRCSPLPVPWLRCRRVRSARCSILFVAAEEQGLLGSMYYSLHPTFAPGRIAANINYDGGNLPRAARKTSRSSATASRRSMRSRRACSTQSGPDPGARPVPGSRLFLPLGPVQLREDRCAGALLQQGHRLHRQARGLGQAAAGRVGRAHLSPAVGSDRRRPGYSTA